MPTTDPLRSQDEPDVRPWPRAMRLIFLLAAGAASWAAAVFLVLLLWKHIAA